MNAHFISFILDFLSWIIAGFYVGYVLYPDKRVKRFSKKFGFIAIATGGFLLGGLYGTLDVALPAYGFAVPEFLYGLLVSIASLLIFSPSFRKTIERQLQRIAFPNMSLFTVFRREVK